MDFSKIPLIQMVTGKMDWLGQRQRVLARNIAHVNTPGYKSSDLTRPDFTESLRRAGSVSHRAVEGPVQLYVTNVAHLPAEPSGDEESGELEAVSPDAPRRPSGNSVVLEEELMKVGKTAMDYELMTNIYRKYAAMFRTALGRGGSS